MLSFKVAKTRSIKARFRDLDAVMRPAQGKAFVPDLLASR